MAAQSEVVAASPAPDELPGETSKLPDGPVHDDVAEQSQEESVANGEEGVRRRGFGRRYGSDQPQPPSRLCRYFVKNQCRYGDECRFSHDPSSATRGPRQPRDNRRHRDRDGPRDNREEASNTQCVFWRQGRCRFGMQCRFAHIGGPPMPAYYAHPAYFVPQSHLVGGADAAADMLHYPMRYLTLQENGAGENRQAGVPLQPVPIAYAHAGAYY